MTTMVPLRNRRDLELYKLSLETGDPGDFMKKSVEVFQRENVNFNFANVARKAGFSSRSYIRAVFSGKKPLTEKALLKISVALKIKKDLEQLLLLQLRK